MKKKLGMLIVALSLLSTTLTGCTIAGIEFELDTNSVGRNDVFSINGEECTKEEARLYLCNYQNVYGNEYGVNLWQHDFGEMAPEDSLERYVKDVTLFELATIMCMNQLAAELEITLTEEELSQVQDATDEYYDSLSKEEKSYMGMDKGELKSFYTKYAVAQKLYTTLTQGVNEEVSDDEARVIRIQQIFVKSEADANTVKTRLAAGADFAAVATAYNEASTIEVVLSRGMLDSAVEDVAFRLNDGECSGMIQTEKGYYFIKCLNKYEKELSIANKDTIIANRRKEQFDDVFAEFLQRSDFKLNEAVWESIKVDTSGKITTDSFFEVYNKYFTE